MDLNLRPIRTQDLINRAEDLRIIYIRKRNLESALYTLVYSTVWNLHCRALTIVDVRRADPERQCGEKSRRRPKLLPSKITPDNN